MKILEDQVAKGNQVNATGKTKECVNWFKNTNLNPLWNSGIPINGLQDFNVVFKISLRRKIHNTKKPAEAEIILRKFHKHLLRLKKRRKYELADTASINQTGSSFITDDKKTYDVTNSKDTWCKSGQSGLDKRQCGVQLTVFADGISPFS